MTTSTADLIDRLGAVKAKAAVLAEEERALKDALVVRLGDNGQGHGQLYDVTISTCVQHRLDANVARGFLTPKELQQATKEVEVTTVNCKARVRERKRRRA